MISRTTIHDASLSATPNVHWKLFG